MLPPIQAPHLIIPRDGDSDVSIASTTSEGSLSSLSDRSTLSQESVTQQLQAPPIPVNIQETSSKCCLCAKTALSDLCCCICREQEPVHPINAVPIQREDHVTCFCNALFSLCEWCFCTDCYEV